jgi:ferredoxin
MTDKEAEIRELFKGMLSEAKSIIQSDRDYQRDLEDFSARVQWEVGPYKGYQVFENGEYTFKIGEEIEDPDLTFSITDLDVAGKLFAGEISEGAVLRRGGKLSALFLKSLKKDERGEYRDVYVGMTGTYSNDFFAKDDHSAMRLSMIPVLRSIFVNLLDIEHATGSPIPINVSLGTFENQVLPLAVTEHFINKASHIFIMEHCPCRVSHKCEDYDHSLGCTWMGRDVSRITAPPEKGHLATKEEALELERKAYAQGLVPTIGRLRGDSVNMGALPDTGHFMSLCHCCPCCCILDQLRFGAAPLHNFLKRMEGVTVSVDEDSCVGCDDCVDVCIFDGLKVLDGRAVIDQSSCLGCGRCETKCPYDAISITIDGVEGFKKMIDRIESFVDVS